MATLKIVALINGVPTPFDGEYVVEYDPGRDGAAPDGRGMTCHLVTTPDRSAALDLAPAEAHRLWTAVDPRDPVRADGEPNRPLTAWHVVLEK